MDRIVLAPSRISFVDVFFFSSLYFLNLIQSLIVGIPPPACFLHDLQKKSHM